MYFLEDKYQPTPKYVEKMKYVGTIDIADGLIDITDPGYESDTYCAMFNYKIKTGKYNAYIDVVNFPALYNINDTKEPNEKTKMMNDYRIMSVYIVHESVPNQRRIFIKELVNDDIGVDAGMCGFYNHKKDFTKEEDWTNFWQNLKTLPKYNNIVCDVQNNSVTVSSGFGDGCYELYERRNEENEAVALKINFY